MTKALASKRNESLFKIWFILYSAIAVYVYYVRTGLTKDEEFYLDLVDAALLKSDTLFVTEHFLHLVILNTWINITNDAPIYILNLCIIFFSS